MATLFPVLIVFLTCVAHSDSSSCHSDHFPCYQDCCLRGEWFCHDQSQTCYHCDTRRVLCGNDSLPIACLHYCYLLEHPPDTDAENKISFDQVTFIAVTATIFLVICCVVVALCFLLWKARHALPVCIRNILRVTGTDLQCDGQIDEDTKETREKTYALHGLTDQEKPLLGDGSSKLGLSRTPSSASSNKSRGSVDVSSLNVTVEPIDDDGEQPTNPRGPDAEAKSPDNGGEAATGGSAHGNSVVQPEGSPVSANGQDRNIADGSRVQNPTPDSGHTPSARGSSSVDPVPRNQLGGSSSGESATARHIPPQVYDVNRPDFSSITPTTGNNADSHDKIVVAPGTRNPAKTCCTESVPGGRTSDC